RRHTRCYRDWSSDVCSSDLKAKLRPSGHDISTKFSTDNGASIPPNILAIPNTESNSAYLRYCSERNLKMHPARYPALLPEYFIRSEERRVGKDDECNGCMEC